MLAYRLVAHGIGGRTVRELNEGRAAKEEGMDSEEFLTWAAYVALEPFPETRADAHVGMLMAQQHNINRGKGKPAKKAGDFMPRWHQPEQTPEQMKAILRMQYLRWNGDPSLLT